jgi:hypothetical protein
MATAANAIVKAATKIVMAEWSGRDAMTAAVADELVQSNPVSGVERPRAKRNRWWILQPSEVRRSLRRSQTLGAAGVPEL